MQTPSETSATKARYVKSYEIRRSYREAVQRPPAVAGVRDTLDIHCHADAGHQDALALAKHASANGMRGILYKSIVGRAQPATAVGEVREALNRWCDEEQLEPITCGAGFLVGPESESAEAVRQQIDAGVRAVWMPVAMHANTLSQVGGRESWWLPGGDRYTTTPPLVWEDALEVGQYALDDRGRLKPNFRDIVHAVADHGAALSFGHATHAEIFAYAEEVEKIGFERAFVDHPFSPFVDLSIEEMQQVARAGVTLNFTYDELSPLLGVDP
ncbi:MAG: hypothetical protein HW416_3087, partial [Chloroflexi bacterium]|nr:hypothetical protein [Chloroflexota bacterium]